MGKVPNFFVDGVSSISHADGVFRISMGLRTGEKEHENELCLFIPASQMGNILQSISGGAREIGVKIKEKMENEAEGSGGGDAKKKKTPKKLQ
jgi:hypothetical protein